MGSLDFSADAGIIISRYRGKGGRERWREGAMEGGSNGRMKAERVSAARTVGRLENLEHAVR